MSSTGYSYTRFSSPEQSKGDSLRRQTAATQEYVTRHGLTLDDTLFADTGVSGFHGKNIREGALGAFVRAVEDKKVKPGSTLLVESLDRLSREKPRTALRHFEKIIELGITVVTLQDGKRYTEASLDEGISDLFQALIIMSRAHEESVTKSKRIGEAWSRKRHRTAATRSLFTSQLPAWIKVIPTVDPLTGDTHNKAALDKNGHLMLDPEKVKAVQRIFKEASRGVGHHRITKLLNAEGVPPISSGSSWNSRYVQNILNNPAVIGRMQPCRSIDGKRIPEGEPIEDYFPRVITDALFLKIQSQRTNRDIPPGRKGKDGKGNLFTGLLRCGKCGEPVHYVDKGNKAGVYLVCSRGKSGGACVYEGWNYKHFEPCILWELQTHVDWSALAPKLTEHAQTLIEQLEEQQASLVVERSNTERKAQNVIRNLEGDDAPSTTLLRTLKAHEANISAIEVQLTSIEGQLSAERDKVAHAQETARLASAAFMNFMRLHSVDATGVMKATAEAKQQARERLTLILREHVKTIRLFPRGTKGKHEGKRFYEIEFKNDLRSPIRECFEATIEAVNGINRAIKNDEDAKARPVHLVPLMPEY